MKKVNLFEELLSERNKQISSKELKFLIKNIWTKSELNKDRITTSLNDKNSDNVNKLKFDKMETKNIFHINTIKKICVRYRLRFFDSNLFKGDYPKNIAEIIKKLIKDMKLYYVIL